MPYCQTDFNQIAPEEVEQVLSLFTEEHFVGGRSVYKLDDGTYSIDAGENDIRAVFDEKTMSIKFFCRYQRYYVASITLAGFPAIIMAG